MENSDELKKLKSLLRQIFRVDLEDLDFGIYKILNKKSDEINNFIDNTLQDVVNKSFQNSNELEHGLIYNYIYNFFSRYFDNGDLIPQLRIGGRDKYYIPYNGRETLLYWATKDEYYVKTMDYFYKYVFIIKDTLDDAELTVTFKIVDMKTPDPNNIKENEKNYFILDDDFLEVENEHNLIVKFNYRPLNRDDYDNYGIKKSDKLIQDKLKEKIRDKIINTIQDQNIKYSLETKENDKTLLEKHLNIYIKKNSSDYFIHKNLKGFLENELDIYLKNEVFDITAKSLELEKEKIMVTKNICFNIIGFLSEIEDFEKMLWEKKKFVFNVNYVITFDRIAKEDTELNLIRKILEHPNIDKLFDEWKELGIIDNGFNKKNITQQNLSGEVLNDKYRFLPIDTKYFKDLELDIISLFHDIDNELDGQLIHSENYQALNTILPKFKEKVQTIYIDPPFNTGKDFLYKDSFQDSSWLSLIENRLKLGAGLLNESGCLFLHLDENANYRGRELLNNIFGEENFRNEIIWAYRTGGAPSKNNPLSKKHDYILYYSRTENIKFSKLKEKIIYEKPFFTTEKDESGNYYALVNLRDFWEGNFSIYNDSNYLIKIDVKPVINVSGERIMSFLTQKPEGLLKQIFLLSSQKGDLIIDFFLGSGTTTAVAHKLKRKWIGIEMGEHFYNLVLPRMKKVLAYDKSSISKDEDVKQNYNENKAGGFFKYFDLEQYEDSLNNITFNNIDKIKDEYNIQYMLNYNIDGSRILLNMSMLQHPFDNEINIIRSGMETTVKVDLCETFNYIFGINIKRIIQENIDNRKYVVYIGTKEDTRYLIAWRDLNNLNYENDRDFIEKISKEHHVNKIMTNGNNIIKDSLSLDPLFKRLLLGE